MTPEAPVIVIGNGPVGQTAALLLARWGVPVVLLDERPRRDLVGSKSICQQRDVLDIWESVGVGAELAAEGLTWTTARTFYREDELFSVTFQDSGVSPFPPFVNISQSRTEAALDTAIARQPGIDVRWGHRVTGIAQDRDQVRVSCQTAQGVVTLTGPYAIACPGARGGLLREQLGLTFDGCAFADKFLICDIRTDLPGWEQERRFYFDPVWNPGRQVLIHPCPDSTYRIDWQVGEDFDLDAETASGGLDTRIRQVIGDGGHEIMWKSVYQFQSRAVDRMRVGRVLVAGDGAHLMAPFGARGLNSGVADADNATWKVAFVLKGWASDALLDSYHSERHAAALENLDVTGATMRFLVPQSEAEHRHRRDTLHAARDDAEARARVDSGRLAEPFWYVDSPLTTPDSRFRFPGRPPKGSVPRPAPGVIVPDLAIEVAGAVGARRLRELVRRGLTVLAGAEADGDAIRRGAAGSGCPVQTYDMTRLSPELPAVLGSAPDQAWIVRPDAHVAAVLCSPDERHVRRAVDRMLGRSPAA